tara:strand:+ start:145 stop:576 length:432 start_codon:yes stop_codon:yes gene_type:complete
MINTNTYHEYIEKLSQDLKKWIDTKEYNDTKWAREITFLPDFLDICLDIYDNKNTPPELKNKAESIIKYAESDFDHLSEAILGNAGLVDDLFIAALFLNEIKNNSTFNFDDKTIKNISHVLLVSKEMLSSSVYSICLKTYKSY